MSQQSDNKGLDRRRFLINGAKTAGALSVPLTFSACSGSPGASLNPTQPGQAVQPRGVHVSFIDDAVTSRGLCWFTDGLDNPGSFVEWAPLAASVPESEWQDINLHPLHFRVEGSAERTTGLDNLTHKVTVNDIDPDQSFRYRVGSDDGGWSPVYVVAPTPKAGQPWKFIHYGDMGDNHRSRRLVAETQKPQHQHDLLLLAGDVSYADGNHERWDGWFNTFEPYLANHVTMAVPGNHEAKDKDVQDDDYTTIPTYAFTNRFHQPGDVSFYGFDYNRIFVYAFTAGAFLEDGKLVQEMVDMELALAQAAARRAAGEIDFIAVFQHYTIWTDQAGRAPGNLSLIAVQEEILARYGVDFLMCGHDHVYQRSARMYKGLPDPTGLGYIQILTGCGGASIRLFEPNIQSWSEKEFIGVGFTEYEVDGDSITVRFFGSGPTDMEVRDDIVHSTLSADFPLEDEFVINKRPLALARDFAKPARGAVELLARYDWPQIEDQIRDRNNRPHRHA